MNRVAAIIQARMGSARLPGKVLETIGGHSVLWHVINRCRAVVGVDVVCCAVPETVESDGVAVEAERCGARVVRGSEADVLARYHKAAKEIGADIIMRVTSDCPLTDPVVNRQVLELLADGGYDYVCNNMPPGFPHGLDCEVFTYAALDAANSKARDPFEREHVTPWLRMNSAIHKANLPGPGTQWAAHRWTLDYPDDLAFFRKLFALLSSSDYLSGYRTIAKILSEHPEITAINATCHDSARDKFHVTSATLRNSR